MKHPNLIGLTGYAGCGKDTVRAMLEAQGYHGMAFADPIRRMLRELLLSAGISTDYMDARALKEAIIPQLGLSYRHLAQTLGTEWGRGLDSALWLKLAGAHIESICADTFSTLPIVVSDVRFTDEAEWIMRRGGVIWRIHRPDALPVREHASEEQITRIYGDWIINNNGTLEYLNQQVIEALELNP